MRAGYEVRQRTEGKPILYRFQKPKNCDYPAMLEFFSRSPDGLDLERNHAIVPVAVGENMHSLSAILMDDNYYRLILGHREVRDGLAMATATALIPLKGRAWLDLNERQTRGEKIDGKDIAKHRSDVFRLAATLAGDAGPDFPKAIKADLRKFVDAFPADSAEWMAILASMKTTFGGHLKPVDLIDTIERYFHL